jgi:hypothetical protein
MHIIKKLIGLVCLLALTINCVAARRPIVEIWRYASDTTYIYLDSNGGYMLQQSFRQEMYGGAVAYKTIISNLNSIGQVVGTPAESSNIFPVALQHYSYNTNYVSANGTGMFIIKNNTATTKVIRCYIQGTIVYANGQSGGPFYTYKDYTIEGGSSAYPPMDMTGNWKDGVCTFYDVTPVQ